MSLDYSTIITKEMRRFGYTDRIYYNKYKNSRSVKIYAPSGSQEQLDLASYIAFALYSAGLEDFKIRIKAHPQSYSWRREMLSFIVTIPPRK